MSSLEKMEVLMIKEPVHEEIIVDEIHYNGNYMIKNRRNKRRWSAKSYFKGKLYFNFFIII